MCIGRRNNIVPIWLHYINYFENCALLSLLLFSCCQSGFVNTNHVNLPLQTVLLILLVVFPAHSLWNPRRHCWKVNSRCSLWKSSPRRWRRTNTNWPCDWMTTKNTTRWVTMTMRNTSRWVTMTMRNTTRWVTTF